ncbi:hypothetical protein UE99_037045 [Burkholderia cenocepacia]|nr:hypothetical protein [Burkholderia cenocepacia]
MDELCRRIMDFAPADLFEPHTVECDDDLTSVFFDEAASTLIHGLRANLCIAARDIAGNFGAPETYAVSGVAFVLLAEVLREALRPRRGTNPSWFSRPKQKADRIQIDQDSLRESVIAVAKNISVSTRTLFPVRNTDYIWPQIMTGDVRADLSELGEFDLVVSSPPYCTRIDYAIATTPELLALGTIGKRGFDDLRMRIMGSVVTESNISTANSYRSDTLIHTLQSIATHPSKAASTYYRRYFSRYFDDLTIAIGQLSSVVRNGRIILVVQNSYFKDLVIDLRQIIIELLEAENFVLETARSYPVRPTIAGSNPRSKIYRDANVRAEEVLVFSK